MRDKYESTALSSVTHEYLYVPLPHPPEYERYVTIRADSVMDESAGPPRRSAIVHPFASSVALPSGPPRLSLCAVGGHVERGRDHVRNPGGVPPVPR